MSFSNDYDRCSTDDGTNILPNSLRTMPPAWHTSIQAFLLRTVGVRDVPYRYAKRLAAMLLLCMPHVTHFSCRTPTNFCFFFGMSY